MPLPEIRAKHDIYILKVGNEYRVRPSVVGLDSSKGGNRLSIQNTTDDEILVVFPKDLFREGDSFILTSTGGSKFSLLNVKTRNKEVNFYHVFAKVGDQLIPAKGESEPIIIVDQ